MSFWAAVRFGLAALPLAPAHRGLDSHLLKDIGVSFTEAEAEANKPFWRA